MYSKTYQQKKVSSAISKWVSSVLKTWFVCVIEFMSRVNRMLPRTLKQIETVLITNVHEVCSEPIKTVQVKFIESEQVRAKTSFAFENDV